MIKIRDGLNGAAWQEELHLLSPECQDVYFTPDYYELQSSIGKGEVLFTVLSEGPKRLLIPGLKLPVPNELQIQSDGQFWDLQSAMGFGGLLASPEADLEFLQDAWAEWRKKCAAQGMVAAFFRLHPLLHDVQWLPHDAQVRAFRKTAFADLSMGLGSAWKKAGQNHRRKVNKGKREGIRVRWDDQQDWEEFEQFYNDGMERKNAWSDAFFPRQYFMKLLTLPWVKLACVRNRGELVAACVFLYGPAWVHYHHSVRSVDCPHYVTNYIIQSALEKASEIGLKGMLLGGGITTALNDSLFVFKRSIGYGLKYYNIALVIANAPVYEELQQAWVKKADQKPNWLMTYRLPIP